MPDMHDPGAWSVQRFADGSAAGRPDDASEWRVLAPAGGPEPGPSEAALFAATQNRANRLVLAGARLIPTEQEAESCV